MKNDLGKDAIGKLVKAIAIPCMIAQFVSVLYSIVDRMYIGNIADVGSLALAGVGVCGPIVTMISAFASLVGVGGAPLASIAMGEGDSAKAGKIIGNAFVLMIVISILVVMGIYPFRNWMLLTFGASQVTLPYASTYFTIVLLGTPFALLSVGMNNFINCQGHAKLGMFSVVIGALSNMILDPIFIFGLNMGVAGAAIATVISQIISSIFVLSVLFSKFLPVRLKLQKLEFKTCLNILRIGLTQFIIIAFDNIMIIAMNAQLQHYGGSSMGDILISVNTIVQSLMLVVLMPLGGISGGTQCILSYNYGAYQIERVKESYKYISKVCILFTSTLFVMIWLFARQFIYLFNNDPIIVETTIKAIRICTLFIIPLGLQYELVDGMTALGQVKISLGLSFFRKTVYFSALFLLPIFFGGMSIFAAEALSDIIAPMFSIYIVKRNLDGILQWRMSMR